MISVTEGGFQCALNCQELKYGTCLTLSNISSTNNPNLKVKCNFMTSIFPLHTALLHLFSKTQRFSKMVRLLFSPRYYECRNNTWKNDEGRLNIADMKTFWLQIWYVTTWVWKRFKNLIDFLSSHNN